MNLVATRFIKNQCLSMLTTDTGSFASVAAPGGRLAPVSAPFVARLDLRLAELEIDPPGFDLIFLTLILPPAPEIHSLPDSGITRFVQFGASHAFGIFCSTLPAATFIYGLVWILPGGAVAAASRVFSPPLNFTDVNDAWFPNYAEMLFHPDFMF
jgi:hypothetical protein